MIHLETWPIGRRTLRAWLVESGDEEVRRQCYELRYEQYFRQKRQIPPREDGLDIDQFDVHSTLMATTLDDDPRPIGTFRYIHAQYGTILTHGRDGGPEIFSGMPFVMPKVNPITGEPIRLDETVEGSRCVGLSIPVVEGDGFSTPDNDIEPGDRIVHSMLLFKASLILARRMGVKQWVCAIHDSHVANCIRDGWNFVEILKNPDGSPHEYKGEAFRVCLLPIPELEHNDYFCRRVLKQSDRETFRPKWVSV